MGVPASKTFLGFRHQHFPNCIVQTHLPGFKMQIGFSGSRVEAELLQFLKIFYLRERESMQGGGWGLGVGSRLFTAQRT